jgi:hypothetical protein
LKNTTTNLKVNTAQARKEKELPKPDQEPKSAITYVPKQTSHAPVLLELHHATHATDFNIDLYRKLTLFK